MVIEYLMALGIAMVSSAITVYFRDMEHILGIVSMVWMYMTPIMYDVSIVPSKLQQFFYLNPMTSVIIAYRDILYYKQIPHISTLVNALVFGIIVMLLGFVVFGRLQKNFAEEL